MVRKCGRGIAEIAVMEVGVRTRSRAAMADASSGTARRRKVRELVKLSSSTTTKTRTTSFAELRRRTRAAISPGNLSAVPSTAMPPERIRGDRPGAAAVVEEVEEQCSSGRSIDREAQVSCCSSNGSSEIADDHERVQEKVEDDHRFADLEDDKSTEVETSTYNSCRERREMTPSSNLRDVESDGVESTAKPTVVNSDRRSAVVVAAEKMPSESELGEFFAAAEKDIQKRFAEKYNYDIAKDTPLEGRYEWVRLKP